MRNGGGRYSLIVTDSITLEGDLRNLLAVYYGSRLGSFCSVKQVIVKLARCILSTWSYSGFDL